MFKAMILLKRKEEYTLGGNSETGGSVNMHNLPFNCLDYANCVSIPPITKRLCMTEWQSSGLTQKQILRRPIKLNSAKQLLLILWHMSDAGTVYLWKKTYF